MEEPGGKTKETLLILDLDETLIFATENPLERRSDFQVGPYHVYKRPGLDRFLGECLLNFRVAVWTAEGSPYAAGIVSALFPNPKALAFVWASNRCTQVYDHEQYEHYHRKSIRKVRRLGYSVERVIVVDNTPRCWEQSYGNLVRVRSYFGEPEDDELEHLLPYLVSLAQEENVRAVEKRMWRTRESK